MLFRSVKVAGGSYGNELNEKAEFQYLKNAFLNKENGVRTPEYVSEAFTKGSDDMVLPEKRWVHLCTSEFPRYADVSPFFLL